jgi:hypothetical protein
VFNEFCGGNAMSEFLDLIAQSGLTDVLVETNTGFSMHFPIILLHERVLIRTNGAVINLRQVVNVHAKDSMTVNVKVNFISSPGIDYPTVLGEIRKITEKDVIDFIKNLCKIYY